MKFSLLASLRCPACHSDLDLTEAACQGSEITAGQLRCAKCGRSYPVMASIPRFVPKENYATSFGMQWNAFRRTQLDSITGVSISADRFYASTGWEPEMLRGRRVLDIGCGAGRFAEIVLEAGAQLVAIDYSSAVDACFANLGSSDRLNVIQADIYSLPFREGQFDFVYCLGVLQHTPDVERAFKAIPKQVKPGGRLAVDVYPKQLRNLLWSKYWIRPVTKRMPGAMLFRLVGVMVKFLLPLSVLIGKIPGVGSKLRYAIPVANYDGVYPLNQKQLREWSQLDTFDMLAPAHDHPQTLSTLRRWLQAAGLENVEVFRHGHLIGRATRSAQP